MKQIKAFLGTFGTSALALLLSMALSLVVAPVAKAQAPNCGCPPKGPEGDDNHDPNDPAFIMINRDAHFKAVGQLALFQMNAAALKKPAELVAEEQAQYKTYLEEVRKNPDGAFASALVVWEKNASADLQRQVLTHACGLVKATEESTALQFMLKALDAPTAQRKECARLGRGNSREKTQAVRQLALLESNPRLRALASLAW